MLVRRVTIALLLVAALAGAQSHARKPRKSSKSHKGSAARVEAPRFDAALVNNPAQPDIHMSEKGSAVLRAQILLDRAHFSCGEIDGEFGTNLGKAVAAFQQERHLQPSRSVDAATWAALNADQAPALMAYSISPEDVKGP